MKNNPQPNKLLNQWFGIQQKLFDQWLTVSAPKSNGELPVAEFFDTATKSQEHFVHACLKTQADWSQQVRNVVDKQEQLPEALKKTVIQVQTMNDNWRELREQLWNNWFKMVKSVDAESINHVATDYANKAMTICQESGQQILESSLPIIKTTVLRESGSNQKDKAKEAA